MLLIILIVVIVASLVYGLRSHGTLNLNERLYLKRRGYEPASAFEEGPPVPKDARLFSLIESLSDVSPFARLRAAEDLSRMCTSGKRDQRMRPALIAALDDSDAGVRGAVATALGNLNDQDAVASLKSRLEIEESIHVRASLQRALEKLGQ